ncbi:MAG TPA: murein biosynthesis integral membrane protein MurJ [Micropepsaceae bacterium]|nr:murein biosynthesis integral membrane protein MurJ [Micropepsaceae bacterium]
MIGRLVSVGGFTALSRIAGFIRDVLMAAVLGAGPMSDAFMVAFRLPNNFRAIFAEGAFNAAFLPRYTAAATKTGTAPTSAATRFADDVFSWQVAVQIVLLVLALVFMRQVVMVLAPGFSDNPDQMRLAVELSRLSFPYLICITIVTQLSAMLNAVEKFRAAAAAPILLNVAMIGTLLAVPLFPSAAHAAAYGVLIAGILQLLFMVRAAARSGLYLRLKRPTWRPEVLEFVTALGAATIGAGSVQIGLFIDTLIASFLPSGDLTALYYADRINQLPMGVIGIALGTVLLPEMSARLAGKDEKGASVAQNRAVVLGMLLTLPCIAAFFIIPDTLMRALFVRGNFGVDAAEQSARALMAYGVGLPGFVLVRCVVPSFYARGDTATPVRATVVSVIANVAMKVFFVWGLDLGVIGIALGTSLGAWVNFGMLMAMARRRGVLVATPELKRAIVPVIAATIGAAAGFFLGVMLGHALIAPGTPFYDLAAFLIAGAAGAGVYALTVMALRRRLPLKAWT